MEQLEEQPALCQQPGRLRALQWRSSKAKDGALLVFLLLQAPATACHAQLADNAERCEKNVNNNPDLALEGCTALIASGQLSGEDLVKVLIDRGLAYSNKAHHDQAIQDFDKAISLKRDTPEAFNNRGLAYEQKGDFDRAIQDYDQAIRLHPSYASAFNNRGLIYAERKGDHDRAIQDFGEAIRLRADYAEALSNRAHSYYAKDDYDRAIQDYDHAIKLEPNYTGNFFDRATAFSGKKDYERALQDLDHALQLNPKDPSLLWARGITRFFLGQFQAARAGLSLSLTFRPEDPYCAIWLYLASSRISEDAKTELKKNSAGLKSAGWPSSTIQMYLGVLSPKDLLASARDADTKKSKNQYCQAYFCMGEDALLRGKTAEAKELLQESIIAGSTGSYEYIGAIAELDRMKTPQLAKTGSHRAALKAATF
jgi:lipoprotein NlpI